MPVDARVKPICRRITLGEAGRAGEGCVLKPRLQITYTAITFLSYVYIPWSVSFDIADLRWPEHAILGRTENKKREWRRSHIVVSRLYPGNWMLQTGIRFVSYVKKIVRRYGVNDTLSSTRQLGCCPPESLWSDCFNPK